MFFKRCGVGKVSKHYGVGHGSVPYWPLLKDKRGHAYVYIQIKADISDIRLNRPKSQCNEKQRGSSVEQVNFGHGP